MLRPWGSGRPGPRACRPGSRRRRAPPRTRAQNPYSQFSRATDGTAPSPGRCCRPPGPSTPGRCGSRGARRQGRRTGRSGPDRLPRRSRRGSGEDQVGDGLGDGHRQGTPVVLAAPVCDQEAGESGSRWGGHRLPGVLLATMIADGAESVQQLGLMVSIGRPDGSNLPGEGTRHGAPPPRGDRCHRRGGFVHPAAADALNTVQSNVSDHVRQLEQGSA